MPWSYRYREDLGLVVEVVLGPFAYEDAVALKGHQLGQLIGGRKLRVVTDLRRAEIEASLEDLRRFQLFQREDNAPQEDSTTAILASTPRTTAFAALYVEGLRGRRRGRVFACLGNAASWLDVGYEDADDLISSCVRASGHSELFGAGAAPSHCSETARALCYHADCHVRTQVVAPTRCHREEGGVLTEREGLVPA